jgi:uncharacterized protein (TIGR01777 family)
MNYLISGASGFIGRALVDFLLARGDSVAYLGRSRAKTMDSRAAFHCWPDREPPPLTSVPRLDAIIHLAGEPVAQRWNHRVKAKIRSSRIDRTRMLVGALRDLRHRPGVLVSASAIGYYGDRGEEILTEASAPGTGFLAQVCADWEREAGRAAEFGVRVVPLRIAMVIGPGGALAKMLPAFRMGLGGRFGSGRQWRSWIDIRDLLRLIAFSAENTAISGPLNASSPNPVRNAEFAASLARAVRRPAPFAVPAWALRAALGELADFVLESARVLPEAAQKAGFVFEHAGLESSFKDALAK